MSKNYMVTTETGARYFLDFRRGFWKYDHKYKQTERLTRFKVAVTDYPGLPWESPQDWRDATEPVLGKRLYVSSRKAWRISTPVASYKEVEED